MNKKTIIILISIFLIILILCLLFVPVKSQVCKLKIKEENLSIIPHIEHCYLDCCDKGILLKPACNNLCYMVD
jgi:hypothetical protein